MTDNIYQFPRNPHQNNEVWRSQRVGKVTASNIWKICSRTRAGERTAQYDKYMVQLLAEELTGNEIDCYKSAAMEWGSNTESGAIKAFEETHGSKVTLCGFVDHPRIRGAGASPDGIVDLEGLIEVKCPNTTTHIEFLSSGVVPDQYIFQMQFQLACSGFDWCYFVSYDPRIKDTELRIRSTKILRHEELIEQIEKDVIEFLEKKEEMLLKIRNNEVGSL